MSDITLYFRYKVIFFLKKTCMEYLAVLNICIIFAFEKIFRVHQVRPNLLRTLDDLPGENNG
jgi:hypothetical protein